MTWTEPKDLPKVSTAPVTQPLFEMHYKFHNGYVWCQIYPKGRPQFPLHCAPIFAPGHCFAEFQEAMKQLGDKPAT